MLFQLFRLILGFLILLGVSGVSAYVKREPAAIHRGIMALTAPSNVLYGQDGQGISPDMIVAFHSWQSQQEVFDIGIILPIDMEPTSDSNRVFSAIADRGLAYYFNRPEVRESFVGRVATEAEEKIKQEVNLAENNGVQHKLNFNVYAFQVAAEIKYTGFTNVAVRYSAIDSSMGVEVSENLSEESDLVLGHSTNTNENISQMAFRISF